MTMFRFPAGQDFSGCHCVQAGCPVGSLPEFFLRGRGCRGVNLTSHLCLVAAPRLCRRISSSHTFVWGWCFIKYEGLHHMEVYVFSESRSVVAKLTALLVVT